VDSVLPEPLERGERLERIARTLFVVHARTYVVVNTFLGLLFWILHVDMWILGIILVSWGVALVLQGMFTFARFSSTDR
jgi:hypothetical protein